MKRIDRLWMKNDYFISGSKKKQRKWKVLSKKSTAQIVITEVWELKCQLRLRLVLLQYFRLVAAAQTTHQVQGGILLDVVVAKGADMLESECEEDWEENFRLKTNEELTKLSEIKFKVLFLSGKAIAICNPKWRSEMQVNWWQTRECV